MRIRGLICLYSSRYQKKGKKIPTLSNHMLLILLMLFEVLI